MEAVGVTPTDTFPVCALTSSEFMHGLPATAHRNVSDEVCEFITNRGRKCSTETTGTAWTLFRITGAWSVGGQLPLWRGPRAETRLGEGVTSQITGHLLSP